MSGCGAAPSSTPTPTPTIDAGNSPGYYLSLGDSLSVGDQPDKLGISLPTSHGYPDQLQALLRGHGRVLSLVKLGCPGETTGTLIHGGVLVTESNAALTTAFNESQARVADVFAAFKSTDLSGTSTLPGSGTVPRAVVLVCEWTWACAAPPVGPNAHANTTGYGVIAATFYAALRG